MKRLFLPVIAAALLLGAPVAAVAAPHHNHAHAQARKVHNQVHRARTTTRQANRATRRAHRATVSARQTTRRGRREIVHARRVRRHAHRALVRNRRELRRWRGAIRAQRRYHWANWHRPHGWYYRRWYVGGYLPRNWLARDYWITNYLAFGLIAPPPDYEWVRQGPDAVLVDINTGGVLRVEYGAFY